MSTLSYEKCPLCKRSFSVLPNELGIVCEEHKTVPKKYYINANQLKAGRIYSDPHGNPFDSFRVAHRQLESMRRDYDNGIFNPDDWVPSRVASYRFDNLVSEWLRGYEIEVENGTKANSYVRTLKHRVRDYILPYFQKLDIRDINSVNIRAFYLDLLQEKKLSSKTVKHILNILHAFLTTHRSIIRLMPDFPKFTVIPKMKKKWIGIDKQVMVLSCVPEEFALPLEVLFDTGMRPGELRALRKKDLRDGYITVSRTFSENTLRERTKTGKEIIHKISLSLWTKLIKLTKEKIDEEYIFTVNNNPYCKDKLYRVWQAACIKAGIEQISLYNATRHSVVSQIKKRKEEEAMIEAAAKTGHSDLKTTRENYAISGFEEIK